MGKEREGRGGGEGPCPPRGQRQGRREHKKGQGRVQPPRAGPLSMISGPDPVTTSKAPCPSRLRGRRRINSGEGRKTGRTKATTDKWLPYPPASPQKRTPSSPRGASTPVARRFREEAADRQRRKRLGPRTRRHGRHFSGQINYRMGGRPLTTGRRPPLSVG